MSTPTTVLINPTHIIFYKGMNWYLFDLFSRRARQVLDSQVVCCRLSMICVPPRADFVPSHGLWLVGYTEVVNGVFVTDIV